MHQQPMALHLTGAVLPSERLRSTVLVAIGIALTATCAQISVHLPWTPVPATGQTFAVLLVAAALGRRLAVASIGGYVVLGAIGLPFYSGASGGWSVATGPTAGYLVGFVMAAALVGEVADRRRDRNPVTLLPALVGASVVIYIAGVAWLAHVLQVSVGTAIHLGLTPFLVGDAIKIGLIGAGLPIAWRAVDRR